MPTCTGGHESQSSDYCDTCGKRFAGTSLPQHHRRGPSAISEFCPSCDTPRQGRFCELCAYDFSNGGSVPAPAIQTPPDRQENRWYAIVTGDRLQYELATERSDRIAFPICFPERRIPLAAPRTRIGRRRASDAVPPEIDLSEPPADPAVSHHHAELIAHDDGTWEIVDCGSKNGTYVHGSTDPIPRHTAVGVGHGTEIRIGAWTAITLQKTEE